MKSRFTIISKFAAILVVFFIITSYILSPKISTSVFKFPYKEAGLTEREAAAHLLSRFTFGATSGQIDEVVKMGLENWFQQQLIGGIKDDSLQARTVEYNALKMTNLQANEVFPRPIQILKMAREDGIIPKDSANDLDRKIYKKQIAQYAREKKYRRQSEFFHQFINYKILRAAYSNNQLHEVLTDFWFNHFNVSFTKKDCALFIPAYERDAIRPFITGKFEDMLLATAKSPAMLLYLDNFNSVANSDDNKMVDEEKMRRRLARMNPATNDTATTAMVQKLKNRKKNQGLNENYAREVMELHTLGVDGGYTQDDVTQAARILTGWTLYPIENSYGSGLKKVLEKIGEDRLSEQGFVHDGDFLFAMNRHDTKPKTVLGRQFATNAGYQEGVELLKMLAHHKSTANFICRKLAVHFVSDNPDQSLVDKMAASFLQHDGNISEVLITMVASPGFWQKNVIREKTKSPFELAISAVRALKADVQQPYLLFGWIEKMGQKIYHYQAPTGFPDKAQYWINTGALLNRMNFGLSIASKQMRGIQTNLLKLNDFHEPESAEDALLTYSKLLMPERNLDQTIKRLTPLLTEPQLDKKIEQAAGKKNTASVSTTSDKDELLVDEAMKEDRDDPVKKTKKYEITTENMLAQVVGIIIGSPEFQRK